MARSGASRRKVRQARPGCFHRPALVPARGQGRHRPRCPPPPATRCRALGQPCTTRPLPAGRHQNLHGWVADGRTRPGCAHWAGNKGCISCFWPIAPAVTHGSGPDRNVGRKEPCILHTCVLIQSNHVTLCKLLPGKAKCIQDKVQNYGSDQERGVGAGYSVLSAGRVAAPNPSMLKAGPSGPPSIPNPAVRPGQLGVSVHPRRSRAGLPQETSAEGEVSREDPARGRPHQSTLLAPYRWTRGPKAEGCPQCKPPAPGAP